MGRKARLAKENRLPGVSGQSARPRPILTTPPPEARILSALERAEATRAPADVPESCVRGVVVNTWTTDDNEGTDYYAEVAWRQNGELCRATLHDGWEGSWGMDSGIGRMRRGDVLHGRTVTQKSFVPHEDLGLEPKRRVTTRVTL